jgi:Galactose oxidase, central domain
MVQWLWTQKQDIGPAPRVNHAMAYDGARKLVVLFGGETSDARYNDTWEWDGEVWTQVADTGPTPRHAHAITFDSVRQRLCSLVA